MDLTELTQQLERVFGTNFVTYYRSHSAHINIKGRNFYQDHKLLQKIYEYLQDNIDTLGEKLRTVGALVPDMLMTVVSSSTVSDYGHTGTSEDLLGAVLRDILNLMDDYHQLRSAADAVDYTDISNMSDDAIGKLARFKWQLEATLDVQE